MRQLLRKLNPTALISVVFLLTLIAAAIFSDQLAPHDPMGQNLMVRLRPPAWIDGGTMEHPLGTDNLGRDIFSQLIFGSRVSLVIAFFAVMVSGAAGSVLGLLSGFYGGILETMVMRLVDIQMSLPFILLALILLSVLGPGFTNIVIVLVATNWIYYARLVRSEVIGLKNQEYVEAARAIGLRNLRILFRHIAPNVVNSVIVLATLRIASMILLESALSFLGLGVQDIATWGVMLANGRHYLNNAWWLATFPGLAIFLTVLSVNLLGDWLRDITDPHIQ